MGTKSAFSVRRVGLLVLAATFALTGASRLYAQQVVQGLLNQQAVGGISINADGMLDRATPDALGQLAKLREDSLQRVPVDLAHGAPLRKISLRGLEAAIDECVKNGKPLPDEVTFLGGLQQIRYVFAYPEKKDIVLVGPAEGWKTDKQGNVVGVSTGWPVMMLDDLLVALRTAQNSAQAGITCSIDPTPEGLAQLKALVPHFGERFAGAAIENALGKQTITFSGVPDTSHFARVLVAADYRMKRLAMNFEPAPIRGLPSFLSMYRGTGRGMSNMLPRWWLEPKYDAVLRDPTGFAWEFRGAAVQAKTEEDFLTASGSREHTGKANPLAQKWADKMTEKYSELALAMPIFAELRTVATWPWWGRWSPGKICRSRWATVSPRFSVATRSRRPNAPRPSKWTARRACSSAAAIGSSAPQAAWQSTPPAWWRRRSKATRSQPPAAS